MRFLMVQFTAAVMGLAIASVGIGSATAQSVMKICGDEWKQAKAAGTTNGETWPQFLAQCRAQQKAGNAAAPAPTTTNTPAPAAPASTYGQVPAGGAKTVRECEAEYAANKAAIRASRQTKRDFVASCRAGTEVIPTVNTAAPPPATYNAPPAPPNSPAPTTYAPAPAPVPASTYQQGSVTSGAGEFTSEQQARYRCPSDTVVWVNTKSRIYHFAGTHNYGTTAHGAYMCEADAKAAGDRAALNETHP